jgi:5-methylcytosine-specific restriction endonuclease McrA
MNAEAIIAFRLNNSPCSSSSRQQAKNNGESHYFTGKKCVNGHISVRRTGDGHCLKCHNEKSKRQYHSDPARHCARQMETVKKNPEVYRAARARRRARKKLAEGNFTSRDITAIGAKQNWKCKNCEVTIKIKYHIDHIMPLALGGSNWPDNLALLCPSCNLRKSDKHPDIWAQENGRLFEC